MKNYIIRINKKHDYYVQANNKTEAQQEAIQLHNDLNNTENRTPRHIEIEEDLLDNY